MSCSKLVIERLAMTFKIKSRLEPREITLTSKSGKKVKKTIDKKQVIFYSEKYAQKAKTDRVSALAKAKDLDENPSRYNQSTSYGAAKYVKNLTFNKKTGEILNDTEKALFFDEKKLRKDEKLDGYYAIMTSKYKESDERIVDLYRELWKLDPFTYQEKII